MICVPTLSCPCIVKWDPCTTAETLTTAERSQLRAELSIITHCVSPYTLSPTQITEPSIQLHFLILLHINLHYMHTHWQTTHISFDWCSFTVQVGCFSVVVDPLFICCKPIVACQGSGVSSENHLANPADKRLCQNFRSLRWTSPQKGSLQPAKFHKGLSGFQD